MTQYSGIKETEVEIELEKILFSDMFFEKAYETLNISVFIKLLIIITMLILLTKIIWKQGEKRYESSGS
ncbi:hypothetical protein [Caviibacter abscessus]|nr:hypothetical protein [Caviibacter abscessus]